MLGAGCRSCRSSLRHQVFTWIDVLHYRTACGRSSHQFCNPRRRKVSLFELLICLAPIRAIGLFCEDVHGGS